MALPELFSPWEHLQDVLRTYHNKLVREEFSDITSDDDISFPRGSLKVACLLADDDTATMTAIRLFLFFFHARKAADLQAPIYGTPISDFESAVKYKPQVDLTFRQDDESIPKGRNGVRARISFRLPNETGLSLTEADLLAIGNRIKSELGTNNGYRWRKGKVLVTYKDLEHGLNLKLYAYDEAEAKEVIRKVCECANKPYDNDFIVTHLSERNYPSNPGTQTILGKPRQKPVQRPVAYVRFHSATLSIHGLPNPITLVGRRYTNPKALVPF